MSKISKSQLIKLQILQAVQTLVKGGLYRSCINIDTNTIKTLSIQVYLKDGVWTPYIEYFEPCGTSVYICYCEGDAEITKELDNYNSTS